MENRRHRLNSSGVYRRRQTGTYRNPRTYQYTDVESYKMLGKLAISLITFLTIFIINSIDRPLPKKMTDKIKVAITHEFDIKQSVGELKFVKRFFPKVREVFGFDNMVSNISSFSLMMPAEGKVIGSFAETGGLDIGRDGGLDVFCAADGEVILVDPHTQGYAITVRHNESLVTVYHNITQSHVERGQTVRQGDIIGTIDSSGDEIAVLHFKVWEDGQPIDPTLLLEKE